MEKFIYLTEDAKLTDKELEALKTFTQKNSFTFEDGCNTDALTMTIEPNAEECMGVIITTSTYGDSIQDILKSYPRTRVVIHTNLPLKMDLEKYDNALHVKTEEEFCEFFEKKIYDDIELKPFLTLPSFLTSDKQHEGNSNSIDTGEDLSKQLDADDDVEMEEVQEEGLDKSIEVGVEPTGELVDDGSTNNDESVDGAGDTNKVTVMKPISKVKKKGSDDDIFGEAQLKKQMRIGVWSPLHRTGVSTFVQSFAFYLSENGYETVVQESLSKRFNLLHVLLRYTKKPKKWSNRINAINGETAYENARWKYHDVHFLPVDSSYEKYEWTEETIHEFYTIHPNVQIQLIDIPSGELIESEETVFKHIDELWIIADDAYHEIATWKNVIKGYSKKYKLPIKVIFNKAQEHSQPKMVEDELELPIIAVLPDMHVHVTRNYYLQKPFYFMDGIKEVYAESFHYLLERIKSESTIKQRGPQRRSQKKMKVWARKLLKAVLD